MATEVTQCQPSVANELEFLKNEVKWFFGFGNLLGPPLSPSYPSVLSWADDDSVYAEVEMPGIEQSDIRIGITGTNHLIIEGERKPPTASASAWLRRERGFGTFRRELTLPAQFEGAKIDARFDQGVLLIKCPKAEAAKPHRIDVTVE